MRNICLPGVAGGALAIMEVQHIPLPHTQATTDLRPSVAVEPRRQSTPSAMVPVPVAAVRPRAVRPLAVIHAVQAVRLVRVRPVRVRLVRVRERHLQDH